MNTNPAWSIAGVGQQTRHVAEEAARRAGMRLDEWLDEAIEQAAGSGARPEERYGEDTWADTVDRRLDRISCRERVAHNPEFYSDGSRGRDDEDLLGSTIERFERQAARSEERAARAFESIARMFEQSNAVRNSDRRALIEAARRLEAIERPSRQGVEAGGGSVPRSAMRSDPDRRFDERMDEIARRVAGTPRSTGLSAPSPESLSEKPRLDLRAAVSQIAMRRRELEAREVRRASPSTRSERGDLARNAGRGDLDAGAREDARSSTDPPGDPRRAEAGRPAPSESLREDIRALAGKLDDLRREQADRCISGVDLNAMRVEIVAMTRSLADLAPRNAVVALEGAIRDLTDRISALRENGHGESLLAPLDEMAAELRATLKAHDPQPIVAGLEREIRAIGGKIDGLAEAAINPETFERIRRQTEEVRNLLAAAAMRSAPVERLERQIGELADRVERLGASPTPHAESAQMAASLDDVRKEIERSTPPSALLSIERRLEHIAERLDQEIARPAHAVIDSRPFDELASRIDGVRRSLEARQQPLVEMSGVETSLKELNAKLDAAGRKDAEPQAVQQLLAEINAKLETIGPWPVDRRAVGEIVEQVVRRLEDRSPGQVDAEVLAEQIAQIHDRLDALTGQTGQLYNVESVARELLDRLRETGLTMTPGGAGGPAEIHSALVADLAELRVEQANADRRTHTRLTGLQDILEKLVDRLASISGDIEGGAQARPPVRAGATHKSPASVLPGVEALGGDLASDIAPRRRAAESAGRADEGKPAARTDGDEASPTSLKGEDFLLEPGAGAPQRSDEARDIDQPTNSSASSAVGAHIAAARRAAQAALAEKKVAPTKASRAAPPVMLVVGGVKQAKIFYANNKRSVVLGIALLIVATVAGRLVGVHAPFLQKSDFGQRPVKAAAIDAPPDKPLDLAGVMAMPDRPIDPTPTASIGPGREPAKAATAEAPEVGAAPPPELLTAIPSGISEPLRDAVTSGAPGAQYELAQRLFEGRGVAQDQKASATWFERAALLGLAPAQYRIAAMYEKGVGVARDTAAAKRWYLKAAEAGNARAAHNLAVMNAETVGERPDYFEAAKWFRKAGESGVRDSQFNLAILYARGLGVEQDLRQSWLWFSLAAAQGDTDAGKKRDEVAARMDAGALAAAADSLAKFKVAKPDPVANEVAAPPGGWDAKSASPAFGQTPSTLGGGARLQTPL